MEVVTVVASCSTVKARVLYGSLNHLCWKHWLCVTLNDSNCSWRLGFILSCFNYLWQVFGHLVSWVLILHFLCEPSILFVKSFPQLIESCELSSALLWVPETCVGSLTPGSGVSVCTSWWLWDNGNGWSSCVCNSLGLLFVFSWVAMDTWSFLA